MAIPTPSDLGVNPSSIAIVIACLVYVIKELIKHIPKQKVITNEDLKEMEFKTNLKGILDEMRKLGDKTHNKVLDNSKAISDLNHTSSRTHKYINEARDNIKTISHLMATGDFCNYKKAGAHE